MQKSHMIHIFMSRQGLREVPLMSTHNMFSWRNKKNNSTLDWKKHLNIVTDCVFTLSIRML